MMKKRVAAYIFAAMMFSNVPLYAMEDTVEQVTEAGVPWYFWALIGTAVIALAEGAWIVWKIIKKRKQEKDVIQELPSIWKGNVDVGRVHEQGARESQQDCFSVSPEDLRDDYGTLAVVADGIGGLEDGDKAAQAAVQAVMEGFMTITGTPLQIMTSALAKAKQSVNEMLRESGIERSGSTLVMGLLKEGRFFGSSIGDSYIFLYRDGRLIHLNRKHTYLYHLLLESVNGKISPEAAFGDSMVGNLMSYLGMGELRDIDFIDSGIEARIGDKFVLMTDGVYNALSEEEIIETLRKPAEEAGVEMRDRVLEKNYSNQDNFTAVILECK